MSGREQHWYREGLRFTCTQCGHCCKVEGYVWVDGEEIRELAAYLGMTHQEFGRRHLRRASDGRLSLIEKANGDCVFWDEGCAVYPARPRQCRTFPFWSENLESRRAWQLATRCCPGTGDGRLYSLVEIVALKGERGQTGG